MVALLTIHLILPSEDQESEKPQRLEDMDPLSEHQSLASTRPGAWDSPCCPRALSPPPLPCAWAMERATINNQTAGVKYPVLGGACSVQTNTRTFSPKVIAQPSMILEVIH